MQKHKSVIGRFFGHWEQLEEEISKQKSRLELQWLSTKELKTKMFELLLSYSNGDLLLHHILPYLTFNEIFYSLYLVNKRIAMIIQNQNQHQLVLRLTEKNICLLMKYFLKDNECRLPHMLKIDKEIIKTSIPWFGVQNNYVTHYIDQEDIELCNTFPSIINFVTGLTIDIVLFYNVFSTPSYYKKDIRLNLEHVYDFIIYFYKNLLLFKRQNPIILSFNGIERCLYYRIDISLFKKLIDLFNEFNNVTVDFIMKTNSDCYYYRTDDITLFISETTNFLMKTKFQLNSFTLHCPFDLSVEILDSLMGTNNEEKEIKKEKLSNLKHFSFIPYDFRGKSENLVKYFKFINEMIHKNCTICFKYSRTIVFSGVHELWNNFYDFLISDRDSINTIFMAHFSFEKLALQNSEKVTDFFSLLKCLSKLNLLSLEFHNCDIIYNTKIKEVNTLNNNPNNIFSNNELLICYLNKIKTPKLIELYLIKLSLQQLPLDLIKSCLKIENLVLTNNDLNDQKISQLLEFVKENNHLTINLNQNKICDISLLNYCINNNINIDLTETRFENIIIGIKDLSNNNTSLNKDILFTINPYDYKFKQFLQSDISLELYLFDYPKFVKWYKSTKKGYFNGFFSHGYQSIINFLSLNQYKDLENTFYWTAFKYLEKKKMKLAIQLGEFNNCFEFYFNIIYTSPLFNNENPFSVKFNYPNGVVQVAIRKCDFVKRKENNVQTEDINVDDWLILTLVCDGEKQKIVNKCLIWDKELMTKEQMVFIVGYWKKLNLK
ncbi:hypothetical protein ABK040_016119 [Willaertia magna]